jgi:hypothetical protein
MLAYSGNFIFQDFVSALISGHACEDKAIIEKQFP